MHTLNYGVIFTSLAHLHPPGGVSGNTLKSWMLKEMAEKQMDRHKQLGWKMAKKGQENKWDYPSGRRDLFWEAENECEKCSLIVLTTAFILVCI